MAKSNTHSVMVSLEAMMMSCAINAKERHNAIAKKEALNWSGH